MIPALYKNEFKVYPDPRSRQMRLLFALKPNEEQKAVAWSIDCSSVHRMRNMEIVGCGDLVQFVADHLYVPDSPLESARLAMVQVLSAAKKVIQFVGGDSYVHVLRDDGGVEMRNFHFSPEVEDVYEFFFSFGRGLLLATGNKDVSDTDFQKMAADFITNLTWKRKQILRGGKDQDD